MPFVLHFKTICQSPRQSPAFPVFSGEVVQPCSCRRVCDPTPLFFLSVWCEGGVSLAVPSWLHGSFANIQLLSRHSPAPGLRLPPCFVHLTMLRTAFHPTPLSVPQICTHCRPFPRLTLSFPRSSSLPLFFFLSLPPSLSPRVYTCSSDPYKPNPVPSIHKRDSLLFMGDFRAHWYSAQ